VGTSGSKSASSVSTRYSGMLIDCGRVFSGASKNFSKMMFNSQLNISAEINGYLSVLFFWAVLLVPSRVAAVFWGHLGHKVDKLS